jgi:cysteine desulfurase
MIVGLGEAAAIAKAEMGKDAERASAIFNKFMKELVGGIKDVYLNGDQQARWCGNVNLSFAYVEGESMIMAIKDLAVSSGSACTSASLEPSYVLRSLGVSEEMAHTSIRFGFGRFTTDEEVDYAINLIKNSISKLREMSPLWEMVQEGVDISKIEWAAH